MIGYLRKLDILNRLFILKYGDLSELDKSLILHLPIIDGMNYVEDFDYSDKTMLLCVLTKKRIYAVLSLVLLDMIIVTKNVFLDSKILLKLRNYYSKTNFNKVVQADKSSPLEREWLVEALKERSIEFILNCMIVCINFELAKNSKSFRDRGLVDNEEFDQNLVIKLNSENLVDKAMAKLSKVYPNIIDY